MSMFPRARLVALAFVAILLTLVVSATAAARPHPSIKSIPHGVKAVCGQPRLPDRARCDAHLITKPNSTRPLASATPPATAYTPTQMRHGYAFDAIGCYPSCGQGQTIAVVDAYDAPNIASDLATFDTQYGLPAPPSFTKVTPPGQSAPAHDAGWEEEIALDVEWAHAMAPAANIVLVESADNSFANLYGAVDYAAANASVVSMSWGGGEYSSELSDDAHFNHPNVTFVASAGDGGHVTDYPAASPLVTAVSGTSLTLDTAGNRSGETAWSCSSSFSCSW